jgi:hypothetical protein
MSFCKVNTAPLALLRTVQPRLESNTKHFKKYWISSNQLEVVITIKTQN